MTRAATWAEPAAGRWWHRVTQWLLVVTIICVTAGVLGIVVRNSVLLGRMTTDVSVAQQRATNLHNLQMAALHLGQTLIELDGGHGEFENVAVRKGLLVRMLPVVESLFPASSGQAGQLREIQAGIAAYGWSGLDGSTDHGAAIADAAPAARGRRHGL